MHQTMVDLSTQELTRRIAAGPPNIYLVDRIPDGRIVHAILEHEHVTRINVYAMSTKTWQRANASVLTQFGPSVQKQPFIDSAKIVHMDPTTVRIVIDVLLPTARAQADGEEAQAQLKTAQFEIALPVEWQAL